MVKYECGFIHLTQDQQDLIVNELFVLLQIAVHVLLQLSTDLRYEKKQTNKKTTQNLNSDWSGIIVLWLTV